MSVVPRPARPSSRSTGRSWRPSKRTTILLGAILLLSAVVGAASFQITLSGETASGVQNTAEFLTHFQQVSATFTATPLPVPAVVSAAAATPTQLPGASGGLMVNAGVAGHEAASWVFHETVGVALNTEIELEFKVGYMVGTTPGNFSATEYVETQATAPVATLTFTFYWDSGQTTGLTILSQLELSQVCAAVGSCP